MATLGKFLQTGDWKGEKHVPVIHAPEKVKAGEGFELKISIGDAIKHPNTLEHHIAWFKVFYVEEGGKFPVELVTFNFSAHGNSVPLRNRRNSPVKQQVRKDLCSQLLQYSRSLGKRCEHVVDNRQPDIRQYRTAAKLIKASEH